MCRSIHDRGLSKRDVDLYTIDRDVRSSLINGITNFSMGKPEGKIKWLTSFLGKEKERKELKKGKS